MEKMIPFTKVVNTSCSEEKQQPTVNGARRLIAILFPLCVCVRARARVCVCVCVCVKISCVPQGSGLGPVLFIQLLSDIINCHPVLHHTFADGTEMYRSTDRSCRNSLLHAMQSCAGDVKDWTLVNKLHLMNIMKTEKPSS